MKLKKFIKTIKKDIFSFFLNLNYFEMLLYFLIFFHFLI